MEEYLVDSHMGGYYTCSIDRKIIERPCEQCGDSDRIVLSYEEGNLFDALKNHFSSLKQNEVMIKDDIEVEIAMEEIVNYLMFQYDEDRCMLDCLLEDELITKDEKQELYKVISMSQKEQFKLLKEIINNGKVKVLTK